MNHVIVLDYVKAKKTSGTLTNYNIRTRFICRDVVFSIGVRTLGAHN